MDYILMISKKLYVFLLLMTNKKYYIYIILILYVEYFKLLQTECSNTTLLYYRAYYFN